MMHEFNNASCIRLALL